MQHTKAATQRQNYHCNAKGHKSNDFTSRRVAVFAEGRGEEEREKPTIEEEEYAWVEFSEEESDERVNFVNVTSIQR